jgi:NAD+ kinase
MISKKFYFVFDKTNKTNQRKKKLLRKFKNCVLHEADIIVVLGGDGFMLQTLKKLGKFNKPFYGINMGTYGFLMNKFKSRKFIENLSKSRPITISALQMVVKTKNNITKKGIAINEISIFRQSKQAATIQIKKGKKIIMKKLYSDGVLVATPAGSTAYNLSVHGPILSLNSKKLAITPISPFRPRRWKGTIVSDKSVISISNLNIKKRPVSVVADNVEFRNVKNVKIYINHKIKFNLLYDSKNSLNKKIKIEQVRREIN